MTVDYEYCGFMAEYWDLFRGDTSEWPDRHFFLELIRRNGEPVLDVGCGTGRLLIDLLGQGIDIDGVDVSPEMLDRCRDKADRAGLQATAWEQSVEELELPRRYATIIVPSSSFQLLVDRNAATEAMRRLRDHLAPGGILAMPFMRLWDGDDPQTTMPGDWQDVREVARDDGAVIRRSSRAWFDIAENLEHTEDLYEVVVDGGVVASERHRRDPATRGYRQDEAITLFADVGLEDIEVLAAWTFDEARPDDDPFVVIGRRSP